MTLLLRAHNKKLLVCLQMTKCEQSECFGLKIIAIVTFSQLQRFLALKRNLHIKVYRCWGILMHMVYEKCLL